MGNYTPKPVHGDGGVYSSFHVTLAMKLLFISIPSVIFVYMNSVDFGSWTSDAIASFAFCLATVMAYVGFCAYRLFYIGDNPCDVPIDMRSSSTADSIASLILRISWALSPVSTRRQIPSQAGNEQFTNAN